MIKIIRPSKKKIYKVECDYCECIFSYQDEDIIHNIFRRYVDQPYGDYVKCPECENIHWINKKYNAEGWTNGCR